MKMKFPDRKKLIRMFPFFLFWTIILFLVLSPKSESLSAFRVIQSAIPTEDETIKQECENNMPEIYPRPVKVEYSNIYHSLYTKKGTTLAYLVSSGDGEIRAAKVFNHQLEKMNKSPLPVVSGLNELPGTCSLAIHFRIKTESPDISGDQSYSLNTVDFSKKRVIEASASGEQGCIYAATALSQLITVHNGKTVLREAVVEDRPAYVRRIFRASHQAKPEQIPDILDWMVRYRMECLKLPTSSWWEINDELGNMFAKVNLWKKEYGGVHIMQALHIYKDKHIIISNPSDRESLKRVIKKGIDNGVDRVMIAADDIAPFKNGEGYILTSDEDKAQFANMAEAHCFLMQDLRHWLDRQGFKCELYYCPPFYTYEDTNLGEMGLYKNTPWEKDAFGPFKRDLQIIGENMPKDVFVIWTGPNVRTRKITDEDFNDWKENLAGRDPFLWDNTMYSHHPFTSTAIFTAYDNEFPEKFHLKTAGSGMYMNGNASAETERASFMTANDFLWNPADYIPKRSLEKSIALLYGCQYISKIIEFRDSELVIRRLKGEQQIKSDIETLWAAIAKVRATTGKNPFYYHQIYIRLKALRNQLICSVPTQYSSKSIQEQLSEFERKRLELLKSLEQAGLENLVQDLKTQMESVSE
jgi:hypothetical protein